MDIFEAVLRFRRVFIWELHFGYQKLTCEAGTQRCSVRKGILRNFAKLTGKHLCQSLFFNKVAGLNLFYRTPLDDCLLFRKDTLAWVFSVNFAKFLGTPFLTEHLWWLDTLRIQWRSGKIMNNTGSLTFSCYQIGHLEIVSLLTGHLKK